MQVTIKNYDEAAAKVAWDNVPDALRKTHEQLMPKVSKDDWQLYHKSEPIRKTVDLFFEKLGAYIGGSSAVKELYQKVIDLPVKNGKADSAAVAAKTKMVKVKLPPKEKVVAVKAAKQFVKPEYNTKEVEHIDSDVAFIKRYVAMNGKVKTADEILKLLKGLQKAMLERRITKQSPYAKEIMAMQDSLSKCYEQMKGVGSIELTIQAAKLKKYLTIAHSEAKGLSITLLTAYVRLHGAKGMRAEAKKLHGRIYKAVHTGKILDTDKYIGQLDKAFANLDNFLQERKEVLSLHEAELNGLSGVEGISGLLGTVGLKKEDVPGIRHKPGGSNGHHFTPADVLSQWLGKARGPIKSRGGLSGVDDSGSLPISEAILPPVAEPVKVMNSMEFARMTFKGIGLTGKWKEFIGDPSPNFTAMVFGKPKFGKSTLCIDFAGYLARHHGRVLYIAKEEGLDRTLQDKLNANDVKHPNLDVASAIPADLTPYRFVFFDSVNRLQLTPEDLIKLKALHPSHAFIYIFQTTKEGNFRGANNFQHDVDVVIEVPERGKAVQFGRFNQGGNMDIF